VTQPAFRRCQARDLVTVDSSKRVKTGDGYLYAPGHLARAGNVQAYRAHELGLDGDPNRIVRLFRPPEEVFAVDAIKSFEAGPVTLDHPAEGWVTAKNWRTLSRGEAVGIAQDGEHLAGELRVRDEEAVKAIETRDKEQLSAGYAFDLDPTAGTSPKGEAYDGIQRNIRGNHFAIVGAARGGTTCRIADEQPKERTMSTRKIAADGLPPFEIDELAAGAIEKHIQTLAQDRDAVIKDFSDAVDSHKAKLAAKDAELTSTKTALTAKDTEIATLKAELATAKAVDVDALVAERSQVTDDAKKLAPELKPTGSSLDIRKAAIEVACAADATNKTVVDAIFGGQPMDKATDSQIKGAFATLLALPKQAALAAQDAAIAHSLGAGTNSAATAGGEVLFGEESMRN
jgi:uncharacterized protein